MSLRPACTCGWEVVMDDEDRSQSWELRGGIFDDPDCAADHEREWRERNEA